MYILKDLQDELKGFIKHEDMSELQRQLDVTRRVADRSVLKDEFLERLSAMHSDFAAKLKNRPTTDYLKKVLRLYDEKIDIFNATLNDQVEKLDRNYTD